MEVGRIDLGWVMEKNLLDLYMENFQVLIVFHLNNEILQNRNRKASYIEQAYAATNYFRLAGSQEVFAFRYEGNPMKYMLIYI